MMLNIHGQRYTTSAQGDTIGRFFGAMEGHGGTLLFYIPVFLLGFFPGALLPLPGTKATGVGVRLDELEPSLPQPVGRGRDPLHTRCARMVRRSLGPGDSSFQSFLHPLAALYRSLVSRCGNSGGLLLESLRLGPGRARPASRDPHPTAVGSVLALAFAVLPRSMPNLPGSWWRSFPIGQVTLGPGPYTVASIFLLGMGLVAYFGLSETRRPAAFWPRAAHWPSSCWPPCS